MSSEPEKPENFDSYQVDLVCPRCAAHAEKEDGYSEKALLALRQEEYLPVGLLPRFTRCRVCTELVPTDAWLCVHLEGEGIPFKLRSQPPFRWPRVREVLAVLAQPRVVEEPIRYKKTGHIVVKLPNVKLPDAQA